MLKIIASVLIVLSSFPALSNVHDFKKMTWNMQGAGDKWLYNIRSVLESRNRQSVPDIIAIQEGGAGPRIYRNGVYTPISGVQQNPGPGSPYSPIPLDVVGFVNGPPRPEVVEFEWVVRGRETSETFYVYGVISDVQDSGTRPGRVNSYIISRQRADEVVLMEHRLQTEIVGVRPHFGIRIGTSYFFSVHSISGGAGANDTAYRLNTIENYVSGQGAQFDWAAIGDFNAEPSDAHREIVRVYPDLLDRGVDIMYSGNATHVGQYRNSELDYMFYRNSQGLPHQAAVNILFFAAVVAFHNSDHFPVKFFRDEL